MSLADRRLCHTLTAEHGTDGRFGWQSAKNYRNPMTRPENFMNPAGNVMKEIKEADLNNFSAGAGEPRVSDGSQFCTSTKECNWGTIMFVCC